MTRNPWLEHRVRPWLVAALVGAVALSVVGLARTFAPEWNGAYLVAACVLAAVEADYSYRLLRARELRGEARLRFRVAELAMIFLLVRVGSFAARGWAGAAQEIRGLVSNPLGFFLATEPLVAFALALLGWRAATHTAEDIEEIDAPAILRVEDTLAPVRLGELYALQWGDSAQQSGAALERLTTRFFQGGALLLVAAGLTRVGLLELLNLERPPVRGLVGNVLFYFLLGLVMLGQVQYATLRRRWAFERVRVSGDLAGRWVRGSFALIGLAALLAFALPTSGTLGLLEALRWGLNVLLSALIAIAVALFFVLTLPIAYGAWLLSMLFRGETLPPPTVQPPLLPPPMPPPAPAGEAGWFEAARLLLFWALTLAIVFFTVRGYLRDHPEMVETAAWLAPLRLLRRGWRFLRGRAGGWRAALRHALPRRSTHPYSQGASSPRRWLRLGGLSPRERVRYYYLSIARRAAARGLPRDPAQTPTEYRATLGANLPDTDADLDQLTTAFVEAQYSAHPIAPDDARRVEPPWQRLRAALRTLDGKRGAESGKRGAGSGER